MRDDIFECIPISEMTLDQLAFRRNGHLHDLAQHHRAGARKSIDKIQQSQTHLADVEAEISRRLSGHETHR